MGNPKKMRRGAPKGNQNARKHGFYSDFFPAVVQKDLENADFDGLNQEIELLRAFIRNYIQNLPQPKTVFEENDILRTLCLALEMLARLIRTQKLYFHSESNIQEAISQALAEVLPELEAQGGVK
jgi:uncharacterized protein YjcR